MVSAGNARQRILQAVAGKANRVFDAKNFFDVLTIQEIIENLVMEICEVGDRAKPGPSFAQKKSFKN